MKIWWLCVNRKRENDFNWFVKLLFHFRLLFIKNSLCENMWGAFSVVVVVIVVVVVYLARKQLTLTDSFQYCIKFQVSSTKRKCLDSTKWIRSFSPPFLCHTWSERQLNQTIIVCRNGSKLCVRGRWYTTSFIMRYTMSNKCQQMVDFLHNRPNVRI